MEEHAAGPDLAPIVTLLGAMVVMVPLFRRLGLGSILGYLAGGLLIGPHGLGWFDDARAILHVAELGVVMFLFVVGLEMQPSHLWGLRRDIFGLGSLQIFTVAALLTGLGVLAGFPPMIAWLGATGFVLTSTAVVMQTLAERGEIALPPGQRIVSILLFEDLLIVPLLAVVAFLSPHGAEAHGSRLNAILLALGTLAGLVAVGIWLLNPLFRLLAASRAREVMTAAALLVVLGASYLMQLGGLSMALGAFLAGVLLSGSAFRHELETDVEPFRGILLGLFFLAVGMALDVTVVFESWRLVAVAVVVMMLAKGAAIYGVARVLRAPHGEAVSRAVMMAQGGEFAFVLFAAAAHGDLLDPTSEARLTAIVVLSMALTPLALLLQERLARAGGPSLDGVSHAEGLSGSVLLIGFGRFGQIVSQALLARDADVTIIDNDPDMIRSAGNFGFKVYYGDGCRLDVLRGSGAATARLIAVCVDDQAAALRIVELVRHEMPHAQLLVRAYDRQHWIELAKHGVEDPIRETFESAMLFGERALLALGEDPADAAAIALDVRRRDKERFEAQRVGGIAAGIPLLRGNRMAPEPFVRPKREGTDLTADAPERDVTP